MVQSPQLDYNYSKAVWSGNCFGHVTRRDILRKRVQSAGQSRSLRKIKEIVLISKVCKKHWNLIHDRRLLLIKLCVINWRIIKTG